MVSAESAGRLAWDPFRGRLKIRVKVLEIRVNTCKPAIKINKIRINENIKK